MSQLPVPLDVTKPDDLEKARAVIETLDPSSFDNVRYPAGSEYDTNVKEAARKMLTYLPGAPLDLVGKTVNPAFLEANLRHEEAKASLPPMSQFDLQVLRTFVKALRDSFTRSQDANTRETIEALEGTIGHLQSTGKIPKDIPVVRRSDKDGERGHY